MKWTNKFNLPLPITSAIRNFQDAYDRVGDISVSGLIKSPRMRQLELRHDNEIEVDYADFLWILLGQAMHKVLETADTTNHLSEERLTMRVNGWVVSGKPDLFTPEYTIDDYKCTSVYAFLLGEKIDWENQLNLYDVLYREHGFLAKKLRVNAILRDHIKAKAMRDRDYPQAGFIVKQVGQWVPATQRAYLEERVTAHQQAEGLADDDLPMCTDEERWKKPDTWAVKKKGGKRALRVYGTELEARCHAESDVVLKQLYVEYRPGSYPRCELYCPVKAFCSFGKTLGQSSEDEAA